MLTLAHEIERTGKRESELVAERVGNLLRKAGSVIAAK